MHLPPPIQMIKQPSAVFGVPSRSRSAHDAYAYYVQLLADELRRSKQPVDPDLLAALNWSPRALLLAGQSRPLPPECFSLLLNHLNLVFQDYAENPEPNLEVILILNPEYCCHLLELDDQKGPLPLRNPTAYYANQLLRDAQWALYYAQTHYSEVYYAKVLELVWRTRNTLAASAFCYHFIRTRNASEAERVTDIAARVNLIQQSPFYGLLTAIHYPELAPQFIPTAFRRPRLLYHWLKLLQLDPVTQATAESHLVSDAAWTVQYVNDCNPANGEELFKTACAKCNNRWLKSWLDQLGPA